jgi:hypothetical protein
MFSEDSRLERTNPQMLKIVFPAEKIPGFLDKILVSLNLVDDD